MLPLDAKTPLSCPPLLCNMYPLHITHIWDVDTPTAPRLPIVALCRLFPTGFPLPLVRLPPPESPMYHLLITFLSSLRSVAGTLCNTLYPPCHWRQKYPRLWPHTHNDQSFLSPHSSKNHTYRKKIKPYLKQLHHQNNHSWYLCNGHTLPISIGKIVLHTCVILVVLLYNRVGAVNEDMKSTLFISKHEISKSTTT